MNRGDIKSEDNLGFSQHPLQDWVGSQGADRKGYGW